MKTKMAEELKQAILCRQDLQLPKGKLGAQCAHASVESVFKADSDAVEEWRADGAKKVVLKVKDEKELLSYFEKAKKVKLPAALIIDAGRTVTEPGTKTCVGIGPAKASDIDKVVGKLHLM